MGGAAYTSVSIPVYAMGLGYIGNTSDLEATQIGVVSSPQFGHQSHMRGHVERRECSGPSRGIMVDNNRFQNTLYQVPLSNGVWAIYTYIFPNMHIAY